MKKKRGHGLHGTQFILSVSCSAGFALVWSWSWVKSRPALVLVLRWFFLFSWSCLGLNTLWPWFWLALCLGGLDYNTENWYSHSRLLWIWDINHLPTVGVRKTDLVQAKVTSVLVISELTPGMCWRIIFNRKWADCFIVVVFPYFSGHILVQCHRFCLWSFTVSPCVSLSSF